jgi:hypothetical protein
MASFNLTSAMPVEGTTFVLGSWVCIADSAGEIHRHLVDNTKLERAVAT